MFQVFPYEISTGLKNLDIDDAQHCMIGAYASLQGVVGRRNPTLATLTYNDSVIVKTAALQRDGTLVDVFAVLLRFTSEKSPDKHGTRVAVLDPSGDPNYVDEHLLVRVCSPFLV